MQCVNCGSNVIPTDRFCGKCGRAIPVADAQTEPAGCPRCSAPFQRGEQYCGTCGAPRSVPPALREPPVHQVKPKPPLAPPGLSLSSPWVRHRRKLLLARGILAAALVGGGAFAISEWNRTDSQAQPTQPQPRLSQTDLSPTAAPGNRPTKRPERSLALSQTDRYLGRENGKEGTPQWEWTVRLVGAPADLADVQTVTYHLHPTFDPQHPVVTGTRENGFALTRTGWGSFRVKATVLFTDGSTLAVELPLQFRDPIRDP